MKILVLMSSVLFLTFSVRSQILIGEPNSKEEKKKQKEQEKEIKDTLKVQPDGNSAVYFVSNWSKTTRILESNGDLFGDTLGQRANEEPLNCWSFGVGVQNQINKNLMWDGGISYVRNGESYIFSGQDTSYSYQTFYSYFAMPLRINYTVGSDIKFYAGAGLMPQIFSSYRQERQWTTTADHKESESFKSKSGYNSFVISGLFNIGIMLNFQNNWSLLVSPEARIQFNSSYLKQDSYIHKSRAYGITFGLVRNL